MNSRAGVDDLEEAGEEEAGEGHRSGARIKTGSPVLRKRARRRPAMGTAPVRG
jgi:hypothetical protein